MQKTKEEKKGIYIIILICVILIIPMVSAGFFDWFQKTITGRGSGESTDVSITVTGVNMVSIRVFNESLTGTAVNPTSNDTTNILFNVTITDADGKSDINDSSVMAELWSSDGTSRENTTACFKISGESDSNSQNYTCGVDLWYWDKNDEWKINVTANDLGNTTFNSTATKNFSYAQLQSIDIEPSTISWDSVTPGDTNQTPSTGNYTTIINVGNYNTSGNISVTGVNLWSGTYFINVGNFTVDIDTEGTPPAECDGSALVNETNVTVSGDLVLESGNITNGEANETIYYCLTKVPSTIASGTYDTSAGGSWTISVFSILLITSLASAGFFKWFRKTIKRKRGSMTKQINLITKSGMILVLAVLLAGSVLAFGVASPYYQGNPLTISPGETRTISLTLQNMMDEEDINIQAKIIGGSQIASLDETEFNVKTGTKDTEVPIEIKIPSNITVNTTYGITVSFKTITPGGGGVVFGTGVDTSFDVLVVSPPREEKPKIKTPIWVVIAAVIIILIIIIIIILRRKKSQAEPIKK